MTEIPKQNLHLFFNQEIIIKDTTGENRIILEKISGGWLCGVSLTYNSAIQILSAGKNDEHSAKYFLK